MKRVLAKGLPPAEKAGVASVGAPKAGDMTAAGKREAEKDGFAAVGARLIRAPKARNMTARGKREAKRSASPLVNQRTPRRGPKGRNTITRITPFQGSKASFFIHQGRR